MSEYDSYAVYTQKEWEEREIEYQCELRQLRNEIKEYKEWEVCGIHSKQECELRQLKDRLVSYEHDVRLLRALEAGGVDNWEGYGEAIEILKG